VIKEFKDGDWIVNEDGICQVYGSMKYYVEDFFKHEFENLKVGDLFENKMVYKIFCHFDGKPRKTKFFSYLSSEYCEILEGEYLKTFESCKAENPELYNKFIERKPSKPLSSRVEFSIRIEPDIREDVIEEINLLLKKFESPFNYEGFDTALREQVDIELPQNLYTRRDTLMTNTLVSLVYNILDSRNCKFSFSGGVAVKTHYSFDDEP